MNETAGPVTPIFDVGAGPSPVPRPERRRLAHRPFHCIRRIAVSHQHGLPPSDAFYPVQCKDISTEGISFVHPNPPCFDHCVIELAAEQQFIHAQIVQISETAHEHLCVVHCDFKGWVLNRG